MLFSPEMAFPQESPPKQVNYLQQGIANLKEENYEEAVEDFKKVREENPDSSIAAYLLGLAYKKVQDYKEAKIHLKDALILKPEVKEAVPELSDVLYQLGEMEEALKEIEFAEGLGMESAQTSFLKGQALSELGKKSDIVLDDSNIIYKGEKYPYTKNNDGTITVEEGSLKGKIFYVSGKAAIASFKKAKSLDERLTASADYQIAMVNIQEGSLEDARDILNEIVIKDPNADIAQAANQYIEIITKRLKEERPFRFTAGIQYQYDTNAILKPSDETAAAGITGEEDNAGIINLRGEYVHKLKSPYNFKAQYSLYQNTHSRLKYIDVQSHSISVVPGYNFSKGSLNLLTSYNYTSVDNNKYLQTITLSPTLTYFLTRTQFGQLTMKYQDKRYLKAPVNSDEDRDSNEKGLGLSYFYLLSEGKGFINGRYEYNREDTEGKN
ncbi:MAG: tetratricopeptide repeat protein [Nitrospinae bacterium]|nr:tetratricopeptide repeat protein [Nitrospinota bacterium]